MTQQRVPGSDVLFETDMSGKESIDIAPAFSPQYSSYVVRLSYVSVANDREIFAQAKQQGADSFDTDQNNYASVGLSRDIGAPVTDSGITDVVGRYYIYDPLNSDTPTDVEGRYANADENEGELYSARYIPEAALEGLRFRAVQNSTIKTFTRGRLRVSGVE